MDFFNATLIVNNLGGACATPQGWNAPVSMNAIGAAGTVIPTPLTCDSAKPWLFYENVGTLPGETPDLNKQVDLKVEVDSSSAYRSNDGAGVNGFGRNNSFGEINLGGRSEFDFATSPATKGTKNEATFIFTLIDHAAGQNTPMEGITHFEFSFYDFDHSDSGYNGRECLKLLEPASSFYVFTAGSKVEQNPGAEYCSKFFGNPNPNR